MIISTYHDFGWVRWVICPVCPTRTRDITGSGRAGQWAGYGRAGRAAGRRGASDGGGYLRACAAWSPARSRA